MNILQTVQKKLEMTQNSGNFLSWTEDTKYVVVASTRVTNLELSKSCASVCYYRACRDDSMCCKCFWCLHHDCCNHGVNVSTVIVAIMVQMSPPLLLCWVKSLAFLLSPPRLSRGSYFKCHLQLHFTLVQQSTSNLFWIEN